MPVRPRRQRRRRLEWSPRIALALAIGPSPIRDRALDDQTLAAAWAVWGDALLADSPPERRPWGFWRFDPDVPESLQAVRPALHPLEDHERVRSEHDGLEARRRAWIREQRAEGRGVS